MVIVSLLNGTVLFLADFDPAIFAAVRSFMGDSSYGRGHGIGELGYQGIRLDVRGRERAARGHILDTGKTSAASPKTARAQAAAPKVACCWTNLRAAWRHRCGLLGFLKFSDVSW